MYSDVSRIANEKAEQIKPRTRDLIAEYICQYPEGRTSEQISWHLQQVKPRPHGWPLHHISPRLDDLRKERPQRVIEAGVRKGSGGRVLQVWVKFESQMDLLLEVA